MSNYNPNKILAAGRFDWNAGAPVTVSNDGFLAPISLNGVGAFPANGAMALVFDNTTWGYSPSRLIVEVQADAGAGSSVATNSITFTGAPVTLTTLILANGAQQAPSGSNPNSQGRPWIYVQTSRLTVDNTGPLVTTLVPIDAPFRITCYATSNPLEGRPPCRNRPGVLRWPRGCLW
jgi:hypothetical protein